MKITISEALSGLPTIDYRKLIKFQGGLKTLTEGNYAKLKASFIERGFFVPVFVWQDEEGGMNLLDGHQRLEVLTGENVKPYKIPFVSIAANSRQEAAEKLLLISSGYGIVTKEGLDAFSLDFDILPDFVELSTSFAQDFHFQELPSPFSPELNPTSANRETTDEDVSEKAKELKDKMQKESTMLSVMCPHCAHEFKISK